MHSDGMLAGWKFSNIKDGVFSEYFHVNDADGNLALLPEGMEQLNETVLENPPTDALVAAAETLPFLAEKRLVVVRELAALTGRSESDERLLDYIGKIPDTCVVIFYVQGKVDARKKLAAALKKQGTVVSFAPLEDFRSKSRS